jgi:hypothetical protein
MQLLRLNSIKEDVDNIPNVMIPFFKKSWTNPQTYKEKKLMNIQLNWKRT